MKDSQNILPYRVVILDPTPAKILLISSNKNQTRKKLSKNGILSWINMNHDL